MQKDVNSFIQVRNVFIFLNFLILDTDSLIFVHPVGRNPLKIGPHLGQLTDEFPKVI